MEGPSREEMIAHILNGGSLIHFDRASGRGVHILDAKDVPSESAIALQSGNAEAVAAVRAKLEAELAARQGELDALNLQMSELVDAEVDDDAAALTPGERRDRALAKARAARAAKAAARPGNQMAAPNENEQP